MASFNQELWRERSRLRRDRAMKRSRSEDHREKVEQRYGREQIAISGLAKIIDWCNQRPLVVEFTQVANGFFDGNENRIEINGRCNPEVQLLWLLHECGHALIDRNDKRITRGIALGVDPEDKRSLVARVILVDEEFEAWSRGLALAERLGVTINKLLYGKQRAHSVATYFKWAIRS